MMLQKIRLVLLALGGVLVAGSSNAHVAEAVAAGTVEDIEKFAWMAGHWRGEGLGGTCEQIWSAPAAGTMMGTFRLIKDDQVVFYEIMVLVNESEGTALKVKHFTPDFVSWEQKDDSIVFRLTELAGQRAVFKGLVIERPDPDHLAITIRLKRMDGQVKDNLLQLRRYEPQ